MRNYLTLVGLAATLAFFPLARLASFSAQLETERPTRQVAEESDAATALAILQEHIPIDYAVELDVDYDGEEWGVTEWDDERETYIIRIHREAQGSVAAETVAEEYAHILTWDAYDEDPHGPLWGVSYARCVREIR